MTPEDDADRLLAYFYRLGLVPRPDPGWQHMGAVLSDAALAIHAHYASTVLPRVRDLKEKWRDADTVSGFTARIMSDDVSAVLRWREGAKLEVLRNLIKTMEELRIETVADLRSQLTGENSQEVRAALRNIHGVGPKTVDYLAILAGSEDDVAIDVHIQRFAAEAGVSDTSYQALRDAMITAARRRGCSPAAFDSAIWTHMSSRDGGSSVPAHPACKA
jgi:hypothetical protein